jgi:ABC-type uncharacterized transport system permease subunit
MEEFLLEQHGLLFIAALVIVSFTWVLLAIRNEKVKQKILKKGRGRYGEQK